MSAISVETVSRTMEAMLTREGRPVIYYDQSSAMDLVIKPGTAASPTGLLPALVVAGEAVWREVTGKGFALDIVRDHEAMLGYRLRGINAGSLTTLMLATLEATAQVTGSGMVIASDLNAVWTAATERLERSARPEPSRSIGAAP